MTDFPVTVETFREHVTSELGDDALQLLLDAAEQAIRARYGEAGTETHDGGQSYIFLRRRAAEVTSVTETDYTGAEVELDETDWRLRGDGVSLLRLSTGLNPPVGWSWRTPTWGTTVTVEYDPDDMDAELARIQIALVELDLNHMPGLTSETIGAWSESANSGTPYAAERETILASFAYSVPPGFA